MSRFKERCEEWLELLHYLGILLLLPLFVLWGRYGELHPRRLKADNHGAIRNEAEVFFKEVQQNHRRKNGPMPYHAYEFGPYRAGPAEALFMSNLLLEGKIHPKARVDVQIPVLYFTRPCGRGVEVVRESLPYHKDKPMLEGTHEFHTQYFGSRGYPKVYVRWDAKNQALQVWSAPHPEWQVGAYDITVTEWRRGNKHLLNEHEV